MPIPPAKSQKLYLMIAAHLTSLIQRDEYKPGDRLPAEGDLAQRLRVSRASVREALVALDLLDIVERRGTEGWFVRRVPNASLDVSAVLGRPPSDILQARVLVESAVIERVALQHDDEDLATLRRTVDDFQAELDRGEYAGEADRLFHLTLARASGNTVFADLVAYLWDLQDEQFFRLAEGMVGNKAPRVERYVAEHRRIYNAVAVFDAPRARDEIRRHLEGVYRDLLGS